MAGLRTLVMEIIRKLSPKNIIAQLEFFQDDFEALINDLKNIKFL
jgi:hypothetical protein